MAAGAALSLALAACSSPPSPQSTPPVSGLGGSPSTTTAPPLPGPSGQTVDPGQPPLIWVGGTLVDVSANRLKVREALGSELVLRRLAGDATGFFRVAGDGWMRLAPEAQVLAGERACVETLMDGKNLLALRVFLGSDCGPV